MGQHTPGPWGWGWQHNDWTDGGLSVNAAGSGMVCTITNAIKGLYQGSFDAPRTLADQEANANLIAAAPDLLAACKIAAEGLTRNWGDDWGSDFEPIRAAIAKAEGRS